MAIKLDFKKLAESARIGDAKQATLKAEVLRLKDAIAKSKAALAVLERERSRLLMQLHLKKSKAKPSTPKPATASITRPADMSDVAYSIYLKTLEASQ